MAVGVCTVACALEQTETEEVVEISVQRSSLANPIHPIGSS